MHAKMLKHGGLAAAQQLTRVMCAAWRRLAGPEARGIPRQWRQVDLINLYKSKARSDTGNYRGISLINVACKAHTLLIRQRVCTQLHAALLPVQMGFTPDCGTPEAVHTLRRTQEIALRSRRQLHAAYIDLRRAFDTVPRAALWAILERHGTDPTLVALIKDLYADNEVCVRDGSTRAPPISPTVGVKQGCPLSPLLFNLFIDIAARELARRHPDLGVRVASRQGQHRLQELPFAQASTRAYACRRLLQILYADDMVILAESWEELVTLLRSLESILTSLGLTVNYDKTHFQHLGYTPPGAPSPCPASLQLRGGSISRVNQFKYLGAIMASILPDTPCAVCGDRAEAHPTLGSMLLCDHPGCDKGYHLACLSPALLEPPPGNWSCPCCPPLPPNFSLPPQPVRHPLDAEICRRLAAASATFGQLSNIWRLGALSLHIKLQFYNAFVLSALLYCAETWAPTEAHIEALEVYHRRCLRTIKGLPLSLQLTNAGLHAAGQRTFPIADFIEQRRLRFFGHLCRRDEGFLPKHMLFAHWFESGSCRAAGRPLLSYCQVMQASLSGATERLRKAGLDLAGIDLGTHACLAVDLAECREWWRSEIVDRARPV